MPEKNQPAQPNPQKPQLQQDAIVEALVPDPTQGPPNAVVLEGHLGRSPNPGTWRLYSTEALDEYVDIPENDILHSQQLPDDQGTRIWVRKTANLQYTQTQSQQVQAEFLSGSIAEGYLGATAANASAAGAGQLLPNPTIRCPSDVVACPSVDICPSTDTPCGSVGPPCPTRFCPSRVVCPSRACPSVQTPCPTRPPICQPSVQIVCPTRPPICQPSVQIACPTQNVWCPTRPVVCQASVHILCPSHPVACVTQQFACHSIQMCPSAGVPCETLRCPSIFCPPSGIACGGGGFGGPGEL